MKSSVMCIQAVVLFTALAIPLELVAQDKPEQRNHHKHHHYKLIDLGTFGGPQSWVFGALEFPSATLSNAGVVGAANTPDSNPNYPNCDPFVPLLCGLYGVSDPLVEHAFEWKEGNLTDLGVLPGGSNSVAGWISGNGLTVGTSENGLIDPLTEYPEGRGILWKDGQATDLGTYGGNESFAGAVNNRGQVAGFATNAIPDAFSGFGTQQRPFLWQNGVKRDLGNLGTGTDGIAYLVNEHGQVAGAAFTNTIIDPNTGIPNQDPFFWEADGKGMQDIGTFGGGLGFANTINNRGQVVGQSNLAGDVNAHPFVWDKKGGLKDLGVLPGGLGASAHWINDAGEIVGASGVQNDQLLHAVLWKHGITDLGTVGADSCSTAQSINLSGQIVGGSFDCGAPEFSHAFIWENRGPMVDLNTLVDPGSGLALVFATSVNDRGEIAGDGLLPNGDNHAFLLIPCDENHPGVEDCDYSLADTTALPQVPVTPAASGRTSGHAFQLPRTRSPFRNRILGRAAVKSGIDGEGEAGQPRSQHTASPQAPIVMLQPASLNFGTVIYGQSSTMTTKLTNVGSSLLTISAINIGGTGASAFSQTNTCGGMVGVGGSCIITVTFKPQGIYLQKFSARVRVVDNASGSPQHVPLSGTGSPNCNFSCSQGKCPLRICFCGGLGRFCQPAGPPPEGKLARPTG